MKWAGNRVWVGVLGTIGGTYPFWQRHRYIRSKTFLRLHVVLTGKAEHQGGLPRLSARALPPRAQNIGVDAGPHPWLAGLPAPRADARGRPALLQSGHHPRRRRQAGARLGVVSRATAACRPR